MEQLVAGPGEHRQQADRRLARGDCRREDLTKAKIDLATFRGKIQTEPRLRDLVGPGRQGAQRVLTESWPIWTQMRPGSRASEESATGSRNSANWSIRPTSTTSSSPGWTSRATRTSRAAPRGEALALYAAPGSGNSWHSLRRRRACPQPEQAEVADGCYGLLLVLAEAEPTPEDGLRRLDEAAHLRPATMAWHLRRAACLARAGRSAEAKREQDAADRTKPATAFDHFLVGQERYKRGDLSAAISEFSAALELQPDQFWSQCLRSVCCLQLQQFSEAKTGLTASLQREPRLAWLFLLRGFSSYQLGVRARAYIQKLPSDEPALRAEAKLQLDAASADYRRAFELLDSQGGARLRFPLLVNQGLLRLERGEFGPAEADLNAASRLDASRLEPLLALAQVYLKQGKPDQAFDQFSRAIALKPDLAALYRGRADVQLARKNPTVAERSSALT